MSDKLDKPCHCFGAMDWILKYSISEIPNQAICNCTYKTKCFELTNAKRNIKESEVKSNERQN